jgi:hypothetical protein
MLSIPAWLPSPDVCRFRPDVLKPGFHRVRTHWIRGFIAFKLPPRARIVVLMVSA